MYCFTDVVDVRVKPIPKGPPAQVWWHFLCSHGYCLVISTMTLTFGLKVKL